MHRVRTTILTLLVALSGSFALGLHFPPDAEFIAIDAEGVIVAHGRSVAGTTVELEVWSGFEGIAQLTLFLPDGTTRAIEVAIEEGVVRVDGVDLRRLLAAAFEDVVVRFVDAQGADVDAPHGKAYGAPGGVAPGVGPDGAPPGQEHRPEEPPGLDRRADDPPGVDRRPEEPPGKDRRP